MSAYKVLECEDADMRRVFDITSLAFQRNEPMWDATYPQHWTEEGRRKAGVRLIGKKNSDPTTTYCKAVNEHGVIVGMAKWVILKDCYPPSEDEIEGGGTGEGTSPEDTAWFNDMIVAFSAPRTAAIEASKGNLVSLDVLAVDPEYQQQGAGKALLAWGTKKADEMGVDMVVEATTHGRQIYERTGFIWQKDVTVEPGERWADRPKQEFAWMVRPKKGGA